LAGKSYGVQVWVGIDINEGEGGESPAKNGIIPLKRRKKAIKK
jgi:hypothetical protein